MSTSRKPSTENIIMNGNGKDFSKELMRSSTYWTQEKLLNNAAMQQIIESRDYIRDQDSEITISASYLSKIQGILSRNEDLKLMIGNHVADQALTSVKNVKLHKFDTVKDAKSLSIAISIVDKVMHENKLRLMYRMSAEFDAPISREVKFKLL